MEELFNKSEAELEEFLKNLWKCESLELYGKYNLSTSPSESEYAYISDNLINDRDIKYPLIVNKRSVSIRIDRNEEFVIGQYYKIKVKLAPLELRKIKENPYLLIHEENTPIIPYKNLLHPKVRLSRFLEHNNLSINRFMGICSENDKGYMILSEIISKENGIQVYTYNGRNLSLAFKKNQDFNIGSYYEFSIAITYNYDRIAEFFIIDNKINKIKEIEEETYKKNIKVEIQSNDKYSFKAKNESEKNQNSTLDYLRRFGINSNRFYGKCINTENGHTIMTEIISIDEGCFLLDEQGNRQSLPIGMDNLLFNENYYYEFSVHHLINSKKNTEFLIIDTKKQPPIELNINPYQEIVRLRYERLDNPEANKMIANLMREIGKGLYSSKQRMIFELLQNADDTPAGDEVHFYIDTVKDYFLIMHNGIPFNRDDVEAITSAAESTKRHDRKKTGYKGIGFKSVFTDSEEVIIKSGGFLFSFMRNYNGFESFDSFYFNKQRYIDYPKLLDEDKLKYTKQRKVFHGNTDIPWQLIPIWQDNLPEVLQETRFVQFGYNNNVGIAIKFGEEKIKDYLDAVTAFALKPHFMLFLRNVTLFKSFKNQIEIKKSGNNPITIEKKNWDGDDVVIKYFKKEIDNIEVNDESISKEGIQIFKRERINEYGEVSHYFSYDSEGVKEIESIPPKLAAFDKTTITLASPIINNKLQAEPAYLRGRLTSSFFTYLPMKEQRIALPFLINADFVPDSSREKLQGDNLWNEYIIAKIARNHVLWLKELADQCVQLQQVHQEYLSLLLKEKLSEDDTINPIINKYNDIYFDLIYDEQFILSDDWKALNTSEIILDEIGISKILGEDAFYAISETSRRLPNKAINSKYLFYDYLDITKFSLSDFCSKLKRNSSSIDKFRESILNLDENNYKNFLDWLNELAKESIVDKSWLLYLPFIRIGNYIFSYNEICEDEESKYLNNDTRIDTVKDILIKLGFEVGNVILDNYENIWDKLDAYKNSDTDIYDIIKENENLSLLIPEEKNRLLLFIKGLDGIGDTKYAQSLALFSNQNQNKDRKPLGKLISNNIENLPEWLIPLRIDIEEENALDQLFRKYLITEKELLSKIFIDPETFKEITINIGENNLDKFYDYLSTFIKYHKTENNNRIQLNGVSDVPWLYINKTKQFVTGENAFFPDSLLKLDKSQYANVRYIIEGTTNLSTPDYSSFNLINELNLGSLKVNFTNLVAELSCISNEKVQMSCNYELLVMADFIDWLVANNETNFLKYNLIVSDNDKYGIIPSDGKNHYYSDDHSLNDFITIQELTTDSFLLLDNKIYNDNCKKIGLYEDDMLIEKLIDWGCTNIDFSKFISLSVKPQISLKYLLSINKIEIDTNQKYDSVTDINKVFSLALNNNLLINEDYNKFRSKILVDTCPLLERAISDDIYFSQTQKELKTKLSEVLPEFKDKVYSLSKVLDSFENIDKSKLKKFFEPIRISTNRIYSELQQKFSEYDAIQTFFLLYYQKYVNSANPFQNKSNFLTLFDKDITKYQTAAQLFLTVSQKENFNDFPMDFKFPDFNPKNTVIEENYIHDGEKMPVWVSNWIEGEDKEARISYLKLLGINDLSSPVVMLRKAIFEGDSDMDAPRGNLSNKVLFTNTLNWMKDNISKCKSIFNDDLLKPLYNRAYSIGLSINEIPVPVINNIHEMTYNLVSYQQGQIFHKFNSNWGEYQEVIFQQLSRNNIKILTDVLPQTYRSAIGTVSYNVVEELNQEKIRNNSEDFTEKFYTTWPKRNQFVIKKYIGSNLPYKVSYNSIEIDSIDKNFAVKNGDYYLVCESIINNIPSTIKDLIPTSLYVDLDAHIKDFKTKINKIEYTDEEIAILKKFLNDDEIPESFRKNLNLASLVSALVNLPKLGFDTERAENNLGETHEYAQLSPVYKGDKMYTIMCRSARQGLLYMTAQSWNRLGNEQILLYTDLGHDDYKLFYSKQEILKANKKDTDYQILRIETDANVSNIDSILDGTFNQLDKLWIIFRVKDNKNYDALYYKKISANNTSQNNSSIKTDFSEIDEY